jgi:S1-C subfamily serine protease
VVVVNGVSQVFEEVSYYLGISGSQIPSFGFGIQKVKSGSPAEMAGLVPGDVIVTINGKPMTDEEILAIALQQSGGVLDLEIVAQGSEEVRAVRVVAERILISSF